MSEIIDCDGCEKEIDIKTAHISNLWVYCKGCYIKHLEKKRDELTKTIEALKKESE